MNVLGVRVNKWIHFSLRVPSEEVCGRLAEHGEVPGAGEQDITTGRGCASAIFRTHLPYIRGIP